MPKVLFLDLEVAPTIATVWGLFNQNIGITQITGNSEVLTWAASWMGEDHVLYSSLAMSPKARLIEDMHKLLCEADYVVTYHGDGFDLKILNKEFLELGLAPPTPYKSVDLLKVVRRNFRFTSNKLDYVSQKLGLGKKIEHRGHQLWLDCMAGSKQAFKEMSEYNIQDVVLLEKLFDKLTPWIKSINYAQFSGEYVCPHCGGTHLQKRGHRVTTAGKYIRLQCQDCGGWSSETKLDVRSDITKRLQPS